MKNSVAFGQAIRRQRGERTQVEIAKLGGPYRQLQARIERGDEVDVSDAVLHLYDNAFGWTPGTAATILQGSQAGVTPSNSRILDGGVLGHDAASGEPIALPRHLRTTLAPETLIPVIAAWPGVAVIDTQVFDLPAQKAEMKAHGLYPKWIGRTTGPTVDELVSQWKTASTSGTVLSSGVLNDNADRIAIDPIPALTNSQEAFALINAVKGIHAGLPEGTDSYQVAWTLLFLACQPRRPARYQALLTVEEPLLDPEAPGFQPFEYTWREFFPPNSPWFEPPFDIASALFAGLAAARTESKTIDLDKSTHPATPIYAGPTVVHPQQLSDRTMVLHNADISPELPAVIAWAVKAPVLVVARDPAPTFTGTGPHVIEVLEPSPYANQHLVTTPYADEHPITTASDGAAVLTHLQGTPNPLLTYGDATGKPVNVVMPSPQRAGS